MAFYTSRFTSPAGLITLVGNTHNLLALRIGTEAAGCVPTLSPRCRIEPLILREEGPLRQARLELEAYFAGEQFSFSVPLAPGGTPFQRCVWEALRSIPYGATLSYGEIASRIGSPAASRAVGAACRANPVAILIPCHRVVSKSGSLTGYAGGLAVKELLLRLEDTHLGGLGRTTAAREIVGVWKP